MEGGPIDSHFQT